MWSSGIAHFRDLTEDTCQKRRAFILLMGSGLSWREVYGLRAVMSSVSAGLGKQQPTRNTILVYHGSCVCGKQTMTTTFDDVS